MLLQIVSLSLNVRHERLARRKLHTSNFSLRRIGLLGLRNEYLGANSFALRRGSQERRLRLLYFLRLFPPHCLIHGGPRGRGWMERPAS